MSDTKLCPFCAEEIKSAAIKCKHCGESLAEAPELAAPIETPAPRADAPVTTSQTDTVIYSDDRITVTNRTVSVGDETLQVSGITAVNITEEMGDHGFSICFGLAAVATGLMALWCGIMSLVALTTPSVILTFLFFLGGGVLCLATWGLVVAAKHFWQPGVFTLRIATGGLLHRGFLTSPTKPPLEPIAEAIRGAFSGDLTPVKPFSAPALGPEASSEQPDG